MTGLEFIAQGFVFERADGRLRVLAPENRPDLLGELRFEVATRTGLVGDGPDYALRPRRDRGDGRCDVTGCGDELPEKQSEGTCVLCTLARQKVLAARPPAVAPPRLPPPPPSGPRADLFGGSR